MFGRLLVRNGHEITSLFHASTTRKRVIQATTTRLRVVLIFLCVRKVISCPFLSFSAMANCVDVDKPFCIINRVDHVIVADSDVPQIVRSDELSATVRTRCSYQDFDASQHSRRNRFRPGFPLLSSRTSEGNAGLSQKFVASPAVGPSLTPTTRAAHVLGYGNCSIVEIFPQVAVLLQVDQDRRLVASFIDQGLHALHGRFPFMDQTGFYVYLEFMTASTNSALPKRGLTRDSVAEG